MVTFRHCVGVTLVRFESVSTWLVLGIWVATLVLGSSSGIIGIMLVCKVELIHPILKGSGELLDIEFVQLLDQVLWNTLLAVSTYIIHIVIRFLCQFVVLLVRLFHLCLLFILWFRRVGGDRAIALLEVGAI
jgi:hypothetical protein